MSTTARIERAATQALNTGLTADEDPALAERQRCILLIEERARSFEQRKLFNLSRALETVAQEISGASTGREI